MSASTQLPDDDPRVVAFETYKRSEEHRLALEWCAPKHPQVSILGGYWTAFMAGWDAAQGPSSAGLVQVGWVNGDELDNMLVPAGMLADKVIALVIEYGCHFHESAAHQSPSRADVSHAAAFKKLGEIRAALAGEPTTDDRGPFGAQSDAALAAGEPTPKEPG